MRHGVDDKGKEKQAQDVEAKLELAEAVESHSPAPRTSLAQAVFDGQVVTTQLQREHLSLARGFPSET